MELWNEFYPIIRRNECQAHMKNSDANYTPTFFRQLESPANNAKFMGKYG
jgi:hypothetical protein